MATTGTHRRGLRRRVIRVSLLSVSVITIAAFAITSFLSLYEPKSREFDGYVTLLGTILHTDT
jgi:hypothetical protein